VTILVCLGESPDTWWQAQNVIAGELLDAALYIAPTEEARNAISLGKAYNCLNLLALSSPLREQVWDAVEQAAERFATDPTLHHHEWPEDWLARVTELHHEMAARRVDPARPGAWPNPIRDDQP
jgi:hypothetical protein